MKKIIQISIKELKEDKEGYKYQVETILNGVIQESNLFISLENAIENFAEQYENYKLVY